MTKKILKGTVTSAKNDKTKETSKTDSKKGSKQDKIKK